LRPAIVKVAAKVFSVTGAVYLLNRFCYFPDANFIDINITVKSGRRNLKSADIKVELLDVTC
jgi:hypothetical protein